MWKALRTPLPISTASLLRYSPRRGKSAAVRCFSTRPTCSTRLYLPTPTHHSNSSHSRNFVRTVIARIGFDLYAIDLYTPMVYNSSMLFVETRLFTSRILDAMSDDEYADLQSHLSVHPDAGAIIPGAGGVRKIRWAGSGRGKRGGSRLIYYWDFCDTILMLYVYQKNERENLTERQKQIMRQIAEEYKHE